MLLALLHSELSPSATLGQPLLPPECGLDAHGEAEGLSPGQLGTLKKVSRTTDCGQSAEQGCGGKAETEFPLSLLA